MRSRDLRPFRVELKSKRRSSLAPPMSLWGQAANLFKTEPDPSGGILVTARTDAPPTAPTNGLPLQAVQTRRVLPDLTVRRDQG